MLYRKNLYTWEQALRLVASVAMIAYPLVEMPGSMIGYVISASGAFLAVTAVIGWCPACAAFGRTLKQDSTKA